MSDTKLIPQAGVPPASPPGPPVSPPQAGVPPTVQVAQRTDPGRDPEKQVNEDACQSGETAAGFLAVVCDGMGGHEGGREASTAAVLTIVQHCSAAAARADISPDVRARELLREGISAANAKVFAMGVGHGGARPGSTVVAVLMHRMGTEVAHVGDSRCYLIHAGQISQVTRDHSMVQQMVDAGVLTPEQAAHHPDANVITRALGLKDDVEVELRPQPIRHTAGDIFVLCSDGLSDLVPPSDIQRIATSCPVDAAANQLIDLANSRGGHDNITVMLLCAAEDALAPRAVAETVGPGMTEVMPAVPLAVGSSGSLPVASATQNQPPAVADVSPAGLVGIAPLPPGLVSRRPARRIPSPFVIVGVVLALVGLAAVITLLVTTARPATTAVPSFAVAPTYAPRPSASMTPLGLSPHDPTHIPEPTPSGRPPRRR